MAAAWPRPARADARRHGVGLAGAAQLAGWELAQAGQLPALLPLTLPAPASRTALRQAPAAAGAWWWILSW
jgi:hypothetical protein